jgi:polyisoprenoid-binding protein YceI
MTLSWRVTAAWIAAGTVAASGIVMAAQSLTPGKSEIAFVVTETGVPVEGAFRHFDASINLDPDKPQAGTVSFSVDTGSVDFATDEIQKELAKPDWFDTARYPKAQFRSDRIRLLEAGRYEVSGALTIKGRTRPLVFPASVSRSGSTLVASGSFAIKRLEFGIGAGEWSDPSLVEDEVKIRFRISLTGTPG